MLYTSLPKDLHARLAEHTELSIVDSLDLSSTQLRQLLPEIQGLIGVNQTVGKELLDLAPKLKVASTISVGYDHFDVAELTRRGIMLMHTPGVLTDSTADMILTLILCAARRVTEMTELVRQGRWRANIGSEYFGSDVYGKKLGIIGMGRIGEAVAKRAHAGFDMEILYYNRSSKKEAEKKFNARRLTLDELLAEADFVCVVLPLSADTNKLIGARELSLMKKSAFLINGGRGPVVDETALIEALQNQSIRGAGLDVYEQEPLPPDSPLMQLPNIIPLPHIGSATGETRYAMAECATNNLINALEGHSTRNCVNHEALSKTSSS
jgi:gluconate 2-dehydrogenase